MVEFEQVTTRGGDRGDTSLYNGDRRAKDENVFEALGDVDELSSCLGLVKARLRLDKLPGAVGNVESIQKLLLTIGGEIATPRASDLFHSISRLKKADIMELEKMEHLLLKETRIEPEFILPGQSLLSAEIDVARSVCRRAERSLVRCIRRDGSIHLALVQNYLNRLSDYLFILARAAEQHKL